MQHFYLKDIVDEISVRENNPSSSGYDRFVGLEHYVSGEVEIHDFGPTSNLASAMKVFKSGDILIARRNVYLRRAGVVKFDGLTSGDSIVLRAKNERIAKLLPFIFNTSEFWDYADQNADGTMSKRLSPKILLEYEINLPEPEEQEKLADLLWSAEESRQAYKKLIKQTDDLIKAKFMEIFNEEKNVASLCNVATVSAGQSSPSDTEFSAEGIPFVKAGNLEKLIAGEKIDKVCYKVNAQIVNKCKLKLKKAGTVLFAKSGMSCLMGYVYTMKQDAYVVSHLACILPDTEKCLPEYLEWHFKIFGTKQFIKDFSYPSIAISDIAEYKIIIPSLSKQRKFVAFVEQAEQTKLATQQSLDALNETVRALVNRNFN